MVDPRRSFHHLCNQLLPGSGVLAAHHRHHIEVRGCKPTAREAILRTTDRDVQTHILRRCLDGGVDHDTCHRLSILPTCWELAAPAVSSVTGGSRLAAAGADQAVPALSFPPRSRLLSLALSRIFP